MTTRLLLVDDDPGILAALQERFAARGYAVTTADDGERALQAFRQRPDVVLLDLQLPRRDGLEVLSAMRAADPAATVVVITAHGTVARAVAAMKAGAYDFVEKPFVAAGLEATIARAAERAALHRRDAARAAAAAPPEPVAESPAMRELLATVHKAAASDATVLITGESGTGKEVVAQLIHRRSARAAEPLVAIHCAALAEGLLESELFGHERGAFTGADRQHRGHIELAHRGTLFLDEVGELRPAVQVKLLRVLQERAIERVGGREPIAVDVRVIAATNRDLAAAVRDGAFRDDLFYRLNVIWLRLPPLRDRRADIVPLARAFLAASARRGGRASELTPEAEQRLVAYSWPGNVRELRNAIERAAVLGEGDSIGPDDLPPEVVAAAPPAAGFHAEVEACRRRLLQDALARCDGNRTRAAELLGLQRTYLARLLRQYGLGGARD